MKHCFRFGLACSLKGQLRLSLLRRNSQSLWAFVSGVPKCGGVTGEFRDCLHFMEDPLSHCLVCWGNECSLWVLAFASMGCPPPPGVSPPPEVFTGGDFIPLFLFSALGNDARPLSARQSVTTQPRTQPSFYFLL